LILGTNTCVIIFLFLLKSEVYLNFSLHFCQQLLVHTWWSAGPSSLKMLAIITSASPPLPLIFRFSLSLYVCVCVKHFLLHSAAELTQRSSLPWLPTHFLKYIFITSALICNIFLHCCQATCAHRMFVQMPIH
jgi:hypothetical protein